MRKQIVTLALAGGLGLTGATLLGPGVAVAQSATPSPSASTDSVGGRVAAITEALRGLVSGGTIDQQQADAVAEALAASDALRGGPGGHGHRGGPGGGLSLDAATEVLGVTADELRTQLEAGRSLAQVAEAEGVSRAALVEALVTAAEEHLAEEVAEGDLTQAEADERAAELQARVEEKVDRVGGPRGGRRHGPDEAIAPRTEQESTPSATPSSTTAA